MRRGLTTAEGDRPWEIHDQYGGHIQEENSIAGLRPACRLFIGMLPARQPGQPGSRT